MSLPAPATSIRDQATPSRRRWFVFTCLIALNFGVWLDEAKLTQLASFWSASLHLSQEQTASVLSAYLLGYAPMLVIAGALADRIGPKRLLLICAAGVTVLSVSMVFVHTYTEMWWRNLVFGLFFGLLWAPGNRIMAVWFPAQSRAKVTSILTASATAAGIVTPMVALPIAHHGSWQLAFVVVAVFCVPPLFAMMRTTDRPEDISGINDAELTLIRSGEPERKATVRFAEMVPLLRNRSVLLVAFTGLLISPIWLALTWLPYGLITLDHVNPDLVAIVAPAIAVVPVVYGFLNGPFLMRVFGGRTRLLIAFGLALGGVAFLAAALIPMHWLVWAILLGGAVMVSNLIFYGTINAYWAGLVGPHMTGVVNGLTACLQVVAGFTLVNLSGGWFDHTQSGHAQLNTTMLIAGVIMLLAVVPMMLAREVTIAPTVDPANGDDPTHAQSTESTAHVEPRG